MKNNIKTIRSLREWLTATERAPYDYEKDVRDNEKIASNDSEIVTSGSRNIAGMTLMELMISLALFSIVTVIATSIFIQIIKTSRLTAQKSAAIDNTVTAMEQLAREVRTGKDFSPSVPLNATLRDNFSFVNYKNQNITYRFRAGILYKTIDGTEYQMTSSDIITSGYFIVNDNSGDTTPRVTISMVAKNSKEIVLSRAQTTIDARLIYYKF